MNIKYTVTLTEKEAELVQERVTKQGLEIVQNPKKSTDRPYAIIGAEEFDIEAGLSALSSEELKVLATKAFVIEKQKDFRASLRHELGLVTAVRETATKVKGDQLAMLESLKATMEPAQYEMTKRIILGEK